MPAALFVLLGARRGGSLGDRACAALGVAAGEPQFLRRSVLESMTFCKPSSFSMTEWVYTFDYLTWAYRNGWGN